MRLLSLNLFQIIKVFQVYQSPDLILLILALGEDSKRFNASDIVDTLRQTVEITGLKSFCQSFTSIPRFVILNNHENFSQGKS